MTIRETTFREPSFW